MRKTVCIMLTIALLAALFAGCTKTEPTVPSTGENHTPLITEPENKPQVQAETETKPEEEPNIKKSKAVLSAESFVSAILAEDYETARAMMGLDMDGSFVTADDIAWYLPRSEFAEIADLGWENPFLESEDEVIGETAYVKINVKESKDAAASVVANVCVKLNKDNAWVVSAPDFYVENYTFRVPGGKTEVEVNGIPLTAEYVTNKSAGGNTLAYEYTLPKAGRKDIAVRVFCANFDYTKDLTPSANNSVGENDYVYPSVEQSEEAIEFIKSLWNGTLEATAADESKASDLLPYIASDASMDLAQTLYDYNKDILKSQYKDIQMARCLPNQDSRCFWITDTKASINFKYELAYKFVGMNANQRCFGCLFLSYEDGVWKLYQIWEPRIWTWLNAYTQDW